jgi:hypothetical protein
MIVDDLLATISSLRARSRRSEGRSGQRGYRMQLTPGGLHGVRMPIWADYSF